MSPFVIILMVLVCRRERAGSPVSGVAVSSALSRLEGREQVLLVIALECSLYRSGFCLGRQE